MRIPMALATLLVVGTASPGSALDVGLGGAGGSVGAGANLGGDGVGVGAGVSLGGGSVGRGGGASIGGGAQAGTGANLGETSAGVGLDAGTGSGRSGGVSATSGGATGGVGTGANANVGTTGSGTRGASARTGSVGSGTGNAVSGARGSADVAEARVSAVGRSEPARSPATLGTATPFRVTTAGPSEAMSLPGRLLPAAQIHEPGSPGPHERPLRPAIAMRPGYRPILSACRAALAEAAVPYGATRVDVAVTGTPRKSSDGGLSAPVEARIIYSRSGRVQVRQARVTCQFDAGGQVVAAL